MQDSGGSDKQEVKDEPNSFVNKNDREDEVDEKTGRKKSKFVDDDYQASLSVDLLKFKLKASGLDESMLYMNKAWEEDKKIKIELKNGQTLVSDRDPDGFSRVSAPPGPADAISLIAMAEIARGKGWPSVTVRGNSEEFRALSFLALQQAGVEMESPPHPHIIEKYRPRFEATLRTGIDPEADHRRREAAAEAEKQAARDAAKKKEEPVAPGEEKPASDDPAPAPLTKTATRTSTPAMKQS